MVKTTVKHMNNVHTVCGLRKKNSLRWRQPDNL